MVMCCDEHYKRKEQGTLRNAHFSTDLKDNGSGAVSGEGFPAESGKARPEWSLGVLSCWQPDLRLTGAEQGDRWAAWGGAGGAARSAYAGSCQCSWRFLIQFTCRLSINYRQMCPKRNHMCSLFHSPLFSCLAWTLTPLEKAYKHHFKSWCIVPVYGWMYNLFSWVIPPLLEV